MMIRMIPATTPVCGGRARRRVGRGGARARRLGEPRIALAGGGGAGLGRVLRRGRVPARGRALRRGRARSAAMRTPAPAAAHTARSGVPGCRRRGVSGSGVVIGAGLPPGDRSMLRPAGKALNGPIGRSVPRCALARAAGGPAGCVGGGWAGTRRPAAVAAAGRRGLPGEGESEAKDAARLGLPGLLPMVPSQQSLLRRFATELLLGAEDLLKVLLADISWSPFSRTGRRSGERSSTSGARSSMVAGPRWRRPPVRTCGTSHDGCCARRSTQPVRLRGGRRAQGPRPGHASRDGAGRGPATQLPGGSASLCSTAHSAACVREARPSLPRMLLT